MKATGIRLKASCSNPDSPKLTEIDSIYLEGCTNPGLRKKETLYDYLQEYPKTIQVNIRPYPNLIPQLSKNNEKYVKSEPNGSGRDNLLCLPRV